MPKILPITTYGTEILRKVSKPIENIDIDTINLVNDMFYTMNLADGIGLAAPQVNKNLSLAVIDISKLEEYKDYKPFVIINPKITDHHGSSLINEGCLSIPEVRGDVKRPEEIYLEYIDINGKEIKAEFSGLLARVLQHEIDHLNGKLFIDYLSEEDIEKNKTLLKKIKQRKINPPYPIYNPKSKY
ncbi:MAG: peptide deformylase [Ignavibacteria bacterium]|nr:peptide deformylase [Ignavibacteria bacterium]